MRCRTGVKKKPKKQKIAGAEMPQNHRLKMKRETETNSPFARKPIHSKYATIMKEAPVSVKR